MPPSKALTCAAAKLQGARLGPRELAGVTVEPVQLLAALLGVTVRALAGQPPSAE